VKNSILANNTENCFLYSLSTNNSAGHNLSDDGNCAGFFNQIGDLNSTPAGLDPNGLMSNGIKDPQTVALLPGSPAINAIPLSPTNYCTDLSGNPVTTDERGVPRPQGPACDIGAFELFQSVNPFLAIPVYDIFDQVQSATIPSIPKAGLALELRVAADLINRGNNNIASDDLKLFVVSVNALARANVLTSQQASGWTTQAQAVINQLASGTGQ
jgi:hypothetical protein